MNKGKEIERFIAEYGEKPHPKSPSVTAEQVLWERELRPWLARAKLDRTEELVNHPIGFWLSAALEDPKVCDKMKADIESFFDICGETGLMSVESLVRQEES